jgi:hypothetical protein
LKLISSKNETPVRARTLMGGAPGARLILSAVERYFS